MILCTISQFSSVHQHLGASLIADYQISSDEFEFIQLVQSFETRSNDDDLVTIIDKYERLYPQINVPRLVALELISYHYTIQPFPFDPTLLPSYNQQVEEINKTKIHSAPVSNDSSYHEILPDPMIQVASGFFVN